MTATPDTLLPRSTRALSALLAGVPLILAVHATRVVAQTVGTSAIVQLGSDAEERLRLDQLLGRVPQGAFLLRSTSRLTQVDDSAHWQLDVLGPDARAIRNSGLPFSMNDGPLWAGRGWNSDITAGMYARFGNVRLIVAPTLVSSQNTAFQVIPYPQVDSTSRNVWANPFHPLPESIDLPLRFGNRARQRLDPGQSSITADAGAVSFGATTENLWWGPGIRNAIVLSNNAPGFPHLFVQTRQPLRSRAGTFDAQWILGQLTQSDFFDNNPNRSARSLAGIAATWVPPFDSAFTFGFTRLVMGARSSNAFPIGAAFDVLRSVGHLNADTTAAVPPNARDQVFSLFTRWLLPADGFEAYAEWARFEEPISPRDFLEFPGHSEGYTIGFQWANPLSVAKALRLQGEASYLEPDPSLRVRWTPTTYTSRAVPQGFTQRGETLGAAIGPGSSSQWLAGDYFAPRWRLGGYLGRIRWDNGVLYEPIVPEYKRPDVTLYAGVRGGVSWRGMDLMLDFAHAARYDYLFQAYTLGVGERWAGIDLINNTLSITLSTPYRRK